MNVHLIVLIVVIIELTFFFICCIKQKGVASKKQKNIYLVCISRMRGTFVRLWCDESVIVKQIAVSFVLVFFLDLRKKRRILSLLLPCDFLCVRIQFENRKNYSVTWEKKVWYCNNCSYLGKDHFPYQKRKNWTKRIWI